MFSLALQKVRKYTLPVIISKRLANGRVECGCGTFIVLNRDGWILTAGHLFDAAKEYNKHEQEIAEYEGKKAAIERNESYSPKQKRKQISRLRPNPNWIVNVSYYWGGINAKIEEILGNAFTDLAVGKLEPFDGNTIQEYPVFNDPKRELLIGTSLCRLGFPFHEITATFDETTNRFTLADHVLPVPYFPNDGIYTRGVIVPTPNGGQVEYIETSSPGLRGQSGGPIFDVQGNIWGIQSRTASLPLGFSPVVKQGGREITEHQFMHVGWGCHVKEIVKFLDAGSIPYRLTTSE